LTLPSSIVTVATGPDRVVLTRGAIGPR
jgi:hypothetical protein